MQSHLQQLQASIRLASGAGHDTVTLPISTCEGVEAMVPPLADLVNLALVARITPYADAVEERDEYNPGDHFTFGLARDFIIHLRRGDLQEGQAIRKPEPHQNSAAVMPFDMACFVRLAYWSKGCTEDRYGFKLHDPVIEYSDVAHEFRATFSVRS